MWLIVWGVIFWELLILKKYKMLNCWTLVLLWVLFAFNYNNPDREAYEQIYQGIYSGYEPGFELLCILGRKMGIQYQAFNALIATICICLLGSTLGYFVEDKNRNISLIVILFFLYPFPRLVTTVRNTLAFCIIMYSLRYLHTGGKSGTIKYIIFIIMASSIHYSSALFIFLFIIKIINLKKVEPVIYIGLAVVFMGISYTSIIPDGISLFLKSRKVLDWFSNRAGVGIFLVVMIHVFTFFVFFIGYKKIRTLKKKETLFFIKDITVCEFIYDLNCISLFLMPFYVFNTLFLLRIYISIILLDYIIYCEVLYNKRIKWSSNEKILYILLMGVQLCSYIIVLSGSEYITLFQSLGNNLLFHLKI